MTEYHFRPKECIETLEAKYSFVSILHNEKLNDSWVVICKNDKESIKVKGDTYLDVLNDAVSMI